MLAQLGLNHPESRVVNHAKQVARAAQALTFPVIVKPNIGGSGARIQRFDSFDEIRAASADGHIDLGFDGTALVQEFLPARDNAIVRVEVLNGEFLYAIKLHLTGDTFNLCPADYCLPNDSNDTA